MKDLFLHPEAWPTEVAAILNDLGDEATYQELQEAVDALRPRGYTFDFDLGATPFGLKKIFSESIVLN
jgi:hypothetical protein